MIFINWVFLCLFRNSIQVLFLLVFRTKKRRKLSKNLEILRSVSIFASLWFINRVLWRLNIILFLFLVDFVSKGLKKNLVLIFSLMFFFDVSIQFLDNLFIDASFVNVLFYSWVFELIDDIWLQKGLFFIPQHV